MSKAERRQAVEPVIGHVTHDHRMQRCHLKGSTGDALQAMACAAGCNIRWLMRAMLRLGLKGLFALVALIELGAAHAGLKWPRHVNWRYSPSVPTYDPRAG
jgi:transposase, IS5 family